MDNNVLAEDFLISGTYYNGFKKAVKEMVGRTDFLVTRIGNLQISTYCEADNGKSGFVLQKPVYGNITQMLGILRNLSVSEIPEGRTFKNDMKKTGFVLSDGSKKYIVSPNAVKTFCRRIGMGGEELDIPSLARDIYIARQMWRHAEEPCVLVTRNNQNTSKIFAVMSEKYMPVKQNILCRAFEVLAKDGAVCRKWTISNTATKIHIEFPSLVDQTLPDEVVPGIILSTSDTGEASLSVQAVHRIGESVAKGNVLSIQHTEVVSLDGFMALIRQIIQELPDFTRKLKQLSSVKVSDDATASMEHTLVQAAGKRNAEKILKSIDIENMTTAYEACMGVYRYRITMKDSVSEKYGTALGTLPQLFE